MALHKIKTKPFVLCIAFVISAVFAQQEQQDLPLQSEQQPQLLEQPPLQYQYPPQQGQPQIIYVQVVPAAQEQKNEYENFGVGLRLGTWALNSFTVPGIGSAILMNDWSGGVYQFVTSSVGTVLLMNGISTGDSWTLSAALTMTFTNFIFNIARSTGYDKPNPNAPQKESVKVGFRTAFGLHFYKINSLIDSEDEAEINGGGGLGTGLVVKIPLGNSISINPGLGLNFRTGGVVDGFRGNDDIRGDYDEFAISLPVLLQYNPFKFLYIAAGIQPEKSFGGNFNEFRTFDIGVPLELGFMVMRNFGIDFRYVIGLTDPFDFGEFKKNNDRNSFSLFSLGITSYF
ncbi:MAG: PorT family protein [Fibromonadaceae bacterium]|jgi:hypothetical protein|nr:PorT family protein [Fibromonadaceae bacterium]